MTCIPLALTAPSNTDHRLPLGVSRPGIQNLQAPDERQHEYAEVPPLHLSNKAYLHTQSET